MDLSTTEQRSLTRSANTAAREAHEHYFHSRRGVYTRLDGRVVVYSNMGPDISALEMGATHVAVERRGGGRVLAEGSYPKVDADGQPHYSRAMIVDGIDEPAMLDLLNPVMMAIAAGALPVFAPDKPKAKPKAKQAAEPILIDPAVRVLRGVA